MKKNLDILTKPRYANKFCQSLGPSSRVHSILDLKCLDSNALPHLRWAGQPLDIL